MRVLFPTPSRVTAAYASLIALLPLIVIPVSVVYPSVQKSLIATLVLGISLGALALSIMFSRERLVMPRSFMPLTGVLVAAAATWSAYSGGAAMSWFGVYAEVGTVISFAVLACTILLASTAPRAIAPRVLDVFTASTGIAAVLSIFLLIVSGETWSGETLVGAWPQLSFLIGAALLVSSIRADSHAKARMCRVALIAILALGSIAFFHAAAAYVTLFFGVITLVVLAIIRGPKRFPYALFAVIALTAILTLGMDRPALVLPGDTRPSATLSEIVLVPTMTGSMSQAAFGEGPGSFAEAFERSRPLSANIGGFSHVSVQSGWSTLMTFIVTIGIVGSTAFVVIPVILIALLSRIGIPSLRRLIPAEGGGVAESTVVLALFAFASACIFPIDMVLFLLGGVAIGLSSRLLVSDEVSLMPEGVRAWLRWISGIPVAAIGVLLVFVVAQQSLGAYYHARGTHSLESGNTEDAVDMLARASAQWSVAPYLREEARAIAALAFATADQERATTGALDAAAFKARADRALEKANRAVAAAPRDHRSYAVRAAISIALIPSGYEHTIEYATLDTDTIKRLAPVNPEAWYLRALVEYRKGNVAEARSQLATALRLKSDYADAQTLLRSLQ